jgi:SAM-dependent methyltransferase
MPSKTVRRAFLLWMAAAALTGAPPASDDRVWADFLAWYKALDRDQAVPALLRTYQAHLASQGRSAADAAAEVERIRQLNAKRTGAAAIHFDKVYRSATPEFNPKPNAFLVEMASQGRPGAALDVGMGQGRNAVWLAQRGWRVTGFDISEEGLAAARANAARAQVTIEAVLASNEEFDWGRERWDLILMCYAFVPLQDAALLERIVASLKPGGRLVFEHFHPDPRRPGMPANPFLKAFEALHVVRFEDVLTRPDWGTGETHVGRLAAEKIATTP